VCCAPVIYLSYLTRIYYYLYGKHPISIPSMINNSIIWGSNSCGLNGGPRLPQGSGPWRCGDVGVLTVLTPHWPGGYQAMGSHRTLLMEWGNTVWGPRDCWSWIKGLQRGQGHLVLKLLGTPEKGMGPSELDLAERKGKGELQLAHLAPGRRESLACSAGGLASWRPWLRELRGILWETRQGSVPLLPTKACSIAPHSGSRWKETVHGFKGFIVMAESCDEWNSTPFLREGLRSDISCREECLRRRAWLTKPFRPLGTSLKWRSILKLYDLCSHSLLVEGLGTLPLHDWWPRIMESCSLLSPGVQELDKMLTVPCRVTCLWDHWGCWTKNQAAFHHPTSPHLRHEMIICITRCIIIFSILI
jgi:hypothetical protein